MRTTKFFQLLIISVILLATFSLSYAAQIEDYTVRETYEYWESFDDGISLGNGNAWGEIVLPAGFSFKYDNNLSVTSVYVYSSGYLRFNYAGHPNIIPVFASDAPAFDSYTVSWYCNNTETTGDFSYKIIGEAPFRTLIIQQLGAQTYLDNTRNTFDVQIRIHETSDEITITYGNNDGIGRQGLDGSIFITGGGGKNEYLALTEIRDPFNGFEYNYGGYRREVLNSDTRNWIYEGRSWTFSPNISIANIYPHRQTILVRDEIYSGTDRPWFAVNRGESQDTIEYRYSIYYTWEHEIIDTAHVWRDSVGVDTIFSEVPPYEDSLYVPFGGTVDSLFTTMIEEDVVIYESDSEPLADDSLEWIRPVPQPEGNNSKIYIEHANALCGVYADGSLDLSLNPDRVIGATYIAKVELRRISGGVPIVGSELIYENTFTIALNSDLAVRKISYPSKKGITIYPYNKIAPVEVTIRNLGNRPVGEFQAIATLTHIATNSKTNITYNFDATTDPELDPLARGDEAIIRNWDIDFVPDRVGEYSLSVTAEILDTDEDDKEEDNILPLVGDPAYVFVVGYDYEGQLLNFTANGLTENTQYVNYPLRLGALLTNNGSIDLADETLTMKVKDPNGVEVFNKTMTIDNVYRNTDFTNQDQNFEFYDIFIPTELGTYTLEASYNVLGDVIPANNTKMFYLNVVEGLKGEYTIAAANGDFHSIGEAVDALYRRGVSGPVTFLLRDNAYIEGNANAYNPAIDLTAKIIGASEENTIEFTVADDDFGSKKIVDLYTDMGIGLLFGQTNRPGNLNAPVRIVNNDMVADYSTSKGYITFNGKGSLHLVLHTNDNYRSVVNFSNGTQNVAIKGCNIYDYQPSQSSVIPGMKFNTSVETFEFGNEDDLSTGILIRNKTPKDLVYLTNYFGLDTLLIKDNVIENNTIHGFGIGIVSCGIATLMRSSDGKFDSYYNENNLFMDNKIYDVAKAGIFIGFEESSIIKGNVIFDVTGYNSDYSYGIYAGGESNGVYYGYNNIDLTIDGNEIYSVTGTLGAYGIFAEQVYTHIVATGKEFILPYDNEETKIINNMVWGIFPEGINSDIVGILLATERGATIQTTIKDDYFTKGDFIANNTVYLAENFNDLIEDIDLDVSDNGIVNNGNIIGIAMVNSMNPKFYNNAIVIDDENVVDNVVGSPIINSAVYYSGLLPRWDVGINSDRNAFELNTNITDLFRMTQLTDEGDILYLGTNEEFQTNDQWYYWTEQDASSVVGVFSDELEILESRRPEDAPGVPNILSLRIDDTPAPQNSILNNRAENLIDDVEFDIDGEPRGNADERFDIGADEFEGSSYIFDLEIVRLNAPGVYKATAGPFSDYEYIMTEIPVEISVKIRNNSSVLFTNPTVYVYVYHEQEDGTFDDNEKVVLNYSITVPTISPYETVDAVLTNVENTFIPETYGDWRRKDGNQPFTNIPIELQAMEPNVTPRYRIKVSLDPDQNGSNIYEKTVRFYLKRATIDMMVTSQHLQYDLETLTPMNNDYTAAQANLDSIISVFNVFNWSTKLGPEPENQTIQVDIFDRTVWEPRSINYAIYRSLIWADGDDVNETADTNRLSNFDIINLKDFFAAGRKDVEDKKNFVVSSQEFVRNNSHTLNGNVFFSDTLRTVVNNIDVSDPIRITYKTNNPLGEVESVTPGIYEFVDYDGETVSGLEITDKLAFNIKSTGIVGDEPPYPCLTTIIDETASVGTAVPAFMFDAQINDNPINNDYAPESERNAGTVALSITHNIIVLNVDWRHWSNPDSIVRACFDYIDGNGIIYPVELLDFEAAATANGIEVTWETVSEINTSHFEVEKSNVENGNIGTFSTIESRRAAGNSNSTIYYGPVIDTKVSNGNTYAYRLKMVDSDGSYSYSKTIIIDTEAQNGALTLNGINPSPVTGTSTLSYSINSDDKVSVELYDITGNRIATLENNFKTAGTYTLDINSSDYATGSYVVVIKSGSRIVTEQINIVK